MLDEREDLGPNDEEEERLEPDPLAEPEVAVDEDGSFDALDDFDVPHAGKNGGNGFHEVPADEDLEKSLSLFDPQENSFNEDTDRKKKKKKKKKGKKKKKKVEETVAVTREAFKAFMDRMRTEILQLSRDQEVFEGRRIQAYFLQLAQFICEHSDLTVPLILARAYESYWQSVESEEIEEGEKVKRVEAKVKQFERELRKALKSPDRMVACLKSKNRVEFASYALVSPTGSKRPAMLNRLTEGTGLKGAYAEYKDAQWNFVRGNCRYVVKCANTYAWMADHLKKEDLVMLGIEGVMRAANRFNPEAGLKFLTLAKSWIVQAMTRAIKGMDRTVRMPDNLQDKISQHNRAFVYLRSFLHRAPDDLELLVELQKRELESLQRWRMKRGKPVPETMKHFWTPLTLARIQRSVRPREVSFDAPIASGDGEGVDTLTTEGVTPSRHTIAGDRQAELLEARDAVRFLFKGLGPREKKIMRERALSGNEATLDDLGKVLRVSRERVRQVQAGAMRKMREKGRREGLDE